MEFDPSRPIWLQLVAEFSRLIVVGEWTPGGRIAGVRELAGDLGVNPNTVQRALSELEREGLCRSERTSGRFVTDDAPRIDTLRNQLAATAVDDYILGVRGLGMTLPHATALVSERWSRHDNNGDPSLTHRPDEE